jgi:hypothetical protein
MNSRQERIFVVKFTYMLGTEMRGRAIDVGLSRPLPHLPKPMVSGGTGSGSGR